MKKRKICIFMCVCITTLSFVGCSTKPIVPSTTKVATSTKSIAKATPTEEKVKVITTQMFNEKQILSTDMYVKNKIHYAVITFRKDEDNKKAKEFATKYALLLKKAYNGDNVNFRIVQNNKTIANVSI